MIALNGRRAHGHAMFPDAPAPAALPHGADLHRITFVAEAAAGQAVVVEFPEAIGRRAVLVDAGSEPVAGELLAASVAGSGEDAELLAKLRDWVEAANPSATPRSVVMTFQGATVVWAAGRVAVVAPAERLDAVRKAVVEVSYYEAELRAVERDLGGRWGLLEADAPLAFEFDEKSVRRRAQLAERFRQVLGLRARLARVTPHVHAPHVYPPTLASQVGERLRERTRMPQRLEFLCEQVEVFEGVYESCGHRASEYMLARRSNALEWVIIVLLAAQILLTLFDVLTASK